MKKVILFTLVALIGLTFSFNTVAQDDAEADPNAELLAAMDFQRFAAYFSQETPGTTFTVEILAERPDGSKAATVQVSFAFDPEQGQRARIDYLTPEELAGDVFIINGDDIFFWNPDLITPLKVNGQFEVFGDATVAEVVGIGFQGAYEVTERSDYTNDDGLDVIELNLVATREEIAFQQARVVANAETMQPITLDLMDENGDLLHHNTFESYDMVEDGRPFFNRQLLDNRVVPVNQTLLIVSNIVNASIDFSIFDETLLGV